MRALIRGHRWLALGLVMAAFALKALVPGGYMLSAGARVITVQLCDDTGAGHLTTQIAIPMKSGSAPSDHAKSQGACPYSSLSHASLGGADPVLLALALTFILLLGFLPLASLPARHSFYLRPPLRGPPLFA